MRHLSFLLFLFLPALAFAHTGIEVMNAWAPPSVGDNGVAYMTLNAAGDDALTGGSSPASKSVELHRHDMSGDVMRMRKAKALLLPDHQPVELKPGGYHLMLIGLKQPLKVGDTVPLTLTFDSGRTSTANVVVKSAPEEMPAMDEHDHSMMHH